MTVIMLHSVGSDQESWYTRWLSCDRTHFYQFCRYLQKKQVRTISLDEWYYLGRQP